MARCRICNVELTDENWYPSCKRHYKYICKICHNKQTNQYLKKSREIHPEKARQRDKKYHIFKKYGITIQEVLNMLQAQGNKCAICGKPLTINDACIDHDHKTGKVRGILCRECNWGLGNFRDNPTFCRNAAKYLEEYLD